MKKITPPAGMAECPFCDCGFNGFDEDGMPYTCYACCETGWMPEKAVADYYRDRAWSAYVAAEKAIIERIELGVPPGWSYYYDREVGEIVMRPPRGYVAPKAAVTADEFDDIPF